MSVCISREQVIARIRQAGWKFKRQADRVELYKKPGSDVQRLQVQRRDLLLLDYVRVVLKQAGLQPAEIEAFLRDAVKSQCPDKSKATR
jgi:hypothetical protein